MYIVKLLDNQEYKSLPFSRIKASLGCADPKTKTAYIRKTGIDLFDLGTIQHEINHLIEKNSTHADEDGIMYKGGDQPEYSPPPAPKLKTAQEIFDESMGFAKQNYPLAYGAREAALADIGKGAEFYKGFGPTSFEEALGSQYFQNIWPDTERQIKQALSLSGMEYSPILAEQLGESRGRIATDIGEYLSNLGQSRAQYSLQSRLGIDPQGVSGPYAQTTMNQSNQQAQLDYEASVARAQADYQNALAKSKEKQSKVTALMTIGGIALGAATGGLGWIGAGGLMAAGVGAGLGGAIGGLASPLFGGGQSPISFSDALAMSQSPQQQKTQDLYNQYLMGNTPQQQGQIGSVQPVNLQSNFKLPTMSEYRKTQGLFG